MCLCCCDIIGIILVQNRSAIKEAYEKGILDVLSNVKIKHGYNESLCKVCEYMIKLIREFNVRKMLFGGNYEYSGFLK